jgi:hypothetical protein
MPDGVYDEINIRKDTIYRCYLNYYNHLIAAITASYLINPIPWPITAEGQPTRHAIAAPPNTPPNI